VILEIVTVSGAVVAAWYLGPMVVRRVQQRRLQRRCTATGTLVLTYDDGPGAELTPKVLELLQQRGARATFFLTGFRAEEHGAVVDRIAAAGHEIGCHGHDHVHAWRSWPWRTVSDVTTGYRTLGRWMRGDGPYRPPFGKMTPLTWAAVRRRRAPIGWWTIKGGDVMEEPPDATAAADRAAKAGGGVVLLHDFDRGDDRADFVLASTQHLLDAAAEHGWSIRTLGELTARAYGEGNGHAG
jgi:peptidoglycan/xylan/chitin deacetylase (PgdA/CDA1 family)